MLEEDKIVKTVLKMFEVNLGLKYDECLLILSEVPSIQDWLIRESTLLKKSCDTALLAKAIEQIGIKNFGKEQIRYFTYPLAEKSGTEPPEVVLDEMVKADVILAITTFSLTHTSAREKACNTGSRMGTMPGATPSMFYSDGVMAADHEKMVQEGEWIAQRLACAESAFLRNPAGTELELSIKGRKPVSSLGILKTPGAWGNLPPGEIYIAPLEGTAFGNVVLEAAKYDDIRDDIKLVFESGKVSSVLGNDQLGTKYRQLLDFGKNDQVHTARRNCAELGIGLNPFAKRLDILLEAEKIRGTVHIAIGSNIHFGGQVDADFHQDFVIFCPTLELDGDIIIKDGEFMTQDKSTSV